MPSFRVRVVRTTTQFVDFYIEADDADLAEEDAQIQALQPGVAWELSDEAESPRVDSDDTEELPS